MLSLNLRVLPLDVTLCLSKKHLIMSTDISFTIDISPQYSQVSPPSSILYIHCPFTHVSKGLCFSNRVTNTLYINPDVCVFLLYINQGRLILLKTVFKLVLEIIIILLHQTKMLLFSVPIRNKTSSNYNSKMSSTVRSVMISETLISSGVWVPDGWAATVTGVSAISELFSIKPSFPLLMLIYITDSWMPTSLFSRQYILMTVISKSVLPQG